MEFTYKLTLWECITVGKRRVLRRLFHESKGFRTLALILGGAAILGSILLSLEEGSFQLLGVVSAAAVLLLLGIMIVLIWLPGETAGVYRQCGKRERTVRIENGSIFLKDGGTVREYWCRDILEIEKRGRLYRIPMTWRGRDGMLMELYLPLCLAAQCHRGAGVEFRYP